MRVQLLIFTSLLIFSMRGFTHDGLVSVESTYTDAATKKTLLVTGRGFIVDYPVNSTLTGNKVNVKVVMTAAHLSVGGIVDKRQTNFIVRDLDSNPLPILGLISNVMHDISTLIVCTQELLSFISKERTALGDDKFGHSDFGKLLLKGGICSGSKKLKPTIKSFAHYETQSGRPLNLDYKKYSVDDWTLSKGHIVVNAENVNYQRISKETAVPLIGNKKIFSEDPSFNAKQLKEELSVIPRVVNLTFSEIKDESFITKALKEGYSGSPILSLNHNPLELTVAGIYKASTVGGSQSTEYGWFTPSRLTNGLVKRFMQDFTAKFHTWFLEPKSYIALVNGDLIRQHYFSEFVLSEEVTEYSDESASFIRDDHGKSGWTRSDTGSSLNQGIPTNVKSKSLIKHTRRFTTPLFGINEEFDEDDLPPILFAPTNESIRYVSKIICTTCTNSPSPEIEERNPTNPFKGSKYLDYLEPITYKKKMSEFVWSWFTAESKDKVHESTYVNTQEKRKRIHKINVKTFFSEDGKKTLHYNLTWNQDAIAFSVNADGTLSYKDSSDRIINQKRYLSAISIRSILGHIIKLEIPGLVFFNTEIPESKYYKGRAFRMEYQKEFYIFVDQSEKDQ